MLDGAALGTLMIHLDLDRDPGGSSVTAARRPGRRSRPASPTIRARLATAMRTVADQIDHAPSAGRTSSSSAA